MGLFGRGKKEKTEEIILPEIIPEEKEDFTPQMREHVQNIYLYCQLALESAETTRQKEQLQVVIAECQRIFDILGNVDKQSL